MSKRAKMFCLAGPYNLADPQDKESLGRSIHGIKATGATVELKPVGKDLVDLWRSKRPDKRLALVRMERGATPVCLGKRGGVKS